MRRLFAWIFVVCMLSGCSGRESQMDRAIKIREKIQSSDCSFLFEMTADYGDSIAEFSLECQADSNGDILFTVAAPESIKGISGTITDVGGFLTFDDQVLAISPVMEDSLSPVFAPWLFLRALRSGYVNSCSNYEDGIRLHIDDSFSDSVYQLHIWIQQDDIPVAVDFLLDGCRIMSAQIKNLSFM